MKNTIKLRLLASLFGGIAVLSCENETSIPESRASQESTETETFFELDQLIEEALESQSVASKKSKASLETVDFVELDRYDGRWFEIAKFPNPFELDCSCTIADYTLMEGQIAVQNSCILQTSGMRNSINGNAVVADPTTNAKLTLTLDGVPFPSNYWILDLVSDPHTKAPYQFAVVGEPSRQNLFLLGRTPRIKTWKQKIAVIKLLINLIRQGYDIRLLESTDQGKDCIYP